MSQPPHHNRFSTHPPEALGIEANAGVMLALVGGVYAVTPRYLEEPEPDQRHAAFALPRLPSWQLEQMTRLLRAVWRQGNACATWVLYLHLLERRWLPFLPPQWCDVHGSLANISYPRVTVPSHELRLVGTYTCSPVESVELLEPQLPPRDGLHLVFHPGDWIRATAFVTAAGVATAVPMNSVIDDKPRPGAWELLQRLLIQTRP